MSLPESPRRSRDSRCVALKESRDSRLLYVLFLVSLVAMGLNGSQKTDEDELCARYIQSLLQGSPVQHMELLCQSLKETDGKKFFDPLQQSVFPKQDFYDCIRTDSIDVVLQASTVNSVLTVENVRKH